MFKKFVTTRGVCWKKSVDWKFVGISSQKGNQDTKGGGGVELQVVFKMR